MLYAPGRLGEVELTAYVFAEGLLGGIVGRNIAIQFFNFHWRVQRSPLPFELKSVHVALNPEKTAATAFVDKNCNPVEKVSDSDNAEIISKMMAPAILNAEEQEEVVFEVTRETDKLVEGELFLNNRRGMLQCVKTEDNDFIRVRCPISQDRFGMLPHRAIGGLLRVKDVVQVEAKMPKHVMAKLREM